MAFPSAIRMLALAAILSSIFLSLIVSAGAVPLGPADVEMLPFWGLPYPYGYAYTRSQLKCWVPQRIETATGPVWERVWVCGNVVNSRY
jgi:hypothetical protein